MVELLLGIGAFLGLGLFASEGASLFRSYRAEQDKLRSEAEEDARRSQLERVRYHMRQIEEASQRGPVDPQISDDYDRLVLEERILEADDLGPLEPSEVDRRQLPAVRARRR